MNIRFKRTLSVVLGLLVVAVWSAATQQQGGSLPAAGVTYERLRNTAAEPHNWMHYWGNYQATHFSPLFEITTRNVARLQQQWSIPLPGASGLRASPLVVDGIMYTSAQPGTVLAIEARTGRRIWQFDRKRKVENPNEVAPVNRGVAVLGNRVYVGTLDAAIVAIDARTGTLAWETQVADSLLGYAITSPPLIVKDRVIVGVAGGEYGAPGFLDAYDAGTGRRVWRWNAIPRPGEFGNDTWAGESWRTGGGPTWLTGSYDPDLDTLYWAVGNPGPQVDRSVRGDGDNLFTQSVVALDPATGRRKWHYQFTPNDGRDWDSTEALILVDRVWHRQSRKLLLHADRNGFLYVLDRTDGRFLAATPFVFQNWNRGFDANGRPIQVPGSNSSTEGSFLVFPSMSGATNFQAPSFSQVTGWLYLVYAEDGQQYVSQPAPFEPGKPYLGRGKPRVEHPERLPNEPLPSAGIKALDPETGQTMWDYKLTEASTQNGVMATAGGVVFAATPEGKFIALDARTGFLLWQHETGGTMAASPMGFGVDGKQYVAVASGSAIHCFALPSAP